MNIEPPTISLLPIEEQQLTAVFLRADGELAARSPVTWRSLYEPVATVDQQGKVIGIAPGNGAILVEAANGLSARAAIQVGHAELGFEKSRMSMAPLTADTISVIVPSQGNRKIGNRQLRFASTNPSVAAVTPLGVVNSIQMGDAQIVVQGFGQEIRLPVTVHRAVRWMTAVPRDRDVTVPVSGSRPLTVTFEADDRTPVPEAKAAWSTTDAGVAYYDESAGRVVGVRVGTATLRASGPGPGLEYEWTINVVAGKVSLARSRIGLARGETESVPAVFVDEDGTELGPVSDLVWQTTNPAVATVDGTGAITAAGFGHTEIIASTSWGDTSRIDVFVQGRVLIASDRAGSSDVYSFDPDDPTNQNRVTDLPGTELGAVYSPDRTRIVFVSHQGANADLVAIDADGSDPVQLTDTPSDEGSPAFTPDGSHIVYTVSSIENERLVSNIWIMNANGSNPRSLTRGSFVRDEPVVSADGSVIAYRSSEAGGRNVFLMNLDGSAVRPVTRDEQSAVSPRWL
ncbi:MAG: Ig-like domain-containing protein, partial [Acidimicrobiia bacterium]|nr:Ig-like domain-containing protein [Acidimicrobiia bacterium]